MVAELVTVYMTELITKVADLSFSTIELESCLVGVNRLRERIAGEWVEYGEWILRVIKLLICRDGRFL